MSDAYSALEYNSMYLACAVLALPHLFEENGAVVLNQMIQERAKLSSQDAFALISDAMRTVRILRLEKQSKKRLAVDQEVFNHLRDRMLSDMGRMQGEVGTDRWKFKDSRRPLTDQESQDLQKLSERGYLDKPKPANSAASTSSGVMDIMQAEDEISILVRDFLKMKGMRSASDEERDMLRKFLSSGIKDLVGVMKDQSFLVVVRRENGKVAIRMRVAEPLNGLDIDI